MDFMRNKLTDLSINSKMELGGLLIIMNLVLSLASIIKVYTAIQTQLSNDVLSSILSTYFGGFKN